jgi:Arc/MetJ-type ribon-helix-helix transcriptional regulator/DNA-binding CsgD family transcriptional regulator
MREPKSTPTAREKAALRAVAEHGTIAAAAAARRKSRHTLDSQLDSLRRKLKIHYLPQLVARAAEEGWLYEETANWELLKWIFVYIHCMASPGKTEEEKVSGRQVKLPPDLWAAVEERVPSRERSAFIRQAVRDALLRRAAEKLQTYYSTDQEALEWAAFAGDGAGG